MCCTTFFRFRASDRELRYFACIAALAFAVSILAPHPLFAQDKHLIDSLYTAFHSEKDPIKRIDLLYDIANEQDDSGKPEDCFRYADSLEQMSKAARYERGLARALDIRGQGLRNEGNFSASIPVFQAQLAIALRIKDLESQSRALNGIGASWKDLFVHDSAVAYQLKCLEAKEKIGDQGDIAATLSNIAGIYSDMKAYDKAIAMLQRALKIRRELGEEKRSMFTLNNLCVAYGMNGQTEKAMSYADSAITIALKYGNKMVAGVVSGSMGHLLNEQKRFEESIRWCEKSLDYLAEAKREANTVFPLTNLAAAYIGLGQYRKALEHNQRGWEIMTRLKLQKPIDEYQQHFAEAYAGLGDYKNAYFWHKAYSARNDSIVQKDNLNKVANMEAKYGLEKKERQLAEQRAANYRQQVGLYALGVALFAFVAFGYLFWNRYRLRKKAELDAAVIREQKLGLNAVIEAQETERKRIAKDLHDGIAQELVALKLGFEALSRRVGKALPEESARFSDLGAQIDASCTEVRTIAHVMMPPTLEQQGLAPSLELLLRSTAQPAGLQTQFENQGLPPALDEKTQIGLYRIAQELLNNVIKHAQASKVAVSLFCKDNLLELTFKDDGQGFDFEEARRKGTMGILNILSRATTLGGDYYSEKNLPHGTVSVVRVPLQSS